MSQAFKDIDFLTSDERPRVWRYSYSAGPVRSKFLLHLRDHQKILGTRCSQCEKVYVPARSICLECFESMEDWVEVSNEGVLETYTVVYGSNDSGSASDISAFGIIKLDGADTGIVHRLGEVDFKKLKIGMKMKAVYEPERRGDIRDIRYFRPINIT